MFGLYEKLSRCRGAPSFANDDLWRFFCGLSGTFDVDTKDSLRGEIRSSGPGNSVCMLHVRFRLGSSSPTEESSKSSSLLERFTLRSLRAVRGPAVHVDFVACVDEALEFGLFLHQQVDVLLVFLVKLLQVVVFLSEVEILVFEP